MPSRLWRVAAFVLAFGPSPARAEADLIAVTLDQAKIARLPTGATTSHRRQPDDRGRDDAHRLLKPRPSLCPVADETSFITWI